MYVNGVVTAPVRETEYRDGWFRIFRKKQVPKFNPQEIDLMRDYMENGQIGEIFIYLSSYREITGDVAEFVFRELLRGNL